MHRKKKIFSTKVKVIQTICQIIPACSRAVQHFFMISVRDEKEKCSMMILDEFTIANFISIYSIS